MLSRVQIPVWMVVTTVAAAIQGDVMEAFRPSLVGMHACFDPIAEFVGVEGETGAEGRDDGDEHLLPRQQPSPDDWEK